MFQQGSDSFETHPPVDRLGAKGLTQPVRLDVSQPGPFRHPVEHPGDGVAVRTRAVIEQQHQRQGSRLLDRDCGRDHTRSYPGWKRAEGSLVIVDLDARVTVACVMTKMAPSLVDDSEARRISRRRRRRRRSSPDGRPTATSAVTGLVLLPCLVGAGRRSDPHVAVAWPVGTCHTRGTATGG